MELTWLNLVAYILIPILTAGIGGWVGAFFGDKYRKDKESKEKEIVTITTIILSLRTYR